MRFIHIADVHLGAVPDKDKSWSKERADEIESTFDRLLAVAEERKVDLLLIAGDLFHAQPSLQDLKSLDYKLSKLTNTRTIMIAGNHDYISKGSPAESYEFTSNTVLMPADTFSNAYLDDINVCVTGFSFGQVEYTEDVYADIRMRSIFCWHMVEMRSIFRSISGKWQRQDLTTARWDTSTNQSIS